MKQLGICINAVTGLDDETYIRTIRQLGFTATFTGIMDRERLGRIGNVCASAGVTMETLHAPFDHINDMWLAGENGDRMLTELKEAVDNCLIAGADIAVVHLSSGDAAPPVTDLGRARFTELVQHAISRNVRIAFENQRKLANLAWAMETFDAPNVGFCWDCGHEGCFTPGREYMPLYADRLICTHIHDNLREYNGDLHMLPFDGRLDFDKVAGYLRNAEFDGAIMLEVFASKSHRYACMTPLEYLQRAAQAAFRLGNMVG